MYSVDAILANKAQQQKFVWQAREWTIFCAKTIEAQSADFWKDLYAAVQGLLKKYGLPQAALQPVPSNRFFIHQPHYPAVHVEVELDTAARVIRMTTVCRETRETEEVRTEQRLPFYLDDAGELYLKLGKTILNPDDAAQFLLKPFIK